MPTLDEATLKLAFQILAGIATVLGAIKVLFKVRADRRHDKAGQRDDEAGDAAEQVYQRTVDRLERNVAALEKSNEAMGKRLDDMGTRLGGEMQARYAAETKANDATMLAAKLQIRLEESEAAAGSLRERVAQLEIEIRGLKLNRLVDGDSR